jgi:ammonium transporter Rh
MATFEVFFYCLNEAILMDIFLVADIGGSMVIHTFGAFFGLSVALFY